MRASGYGMLLRPSHPTPLAEAEAEAAQQAAATTTNASLAPGQRHTLHAQQRSSTTQLQASAVPAREAPSAESGATQPQYRVPDPLPGAAAAGYGMLLRLCKGPESGALSLGTLKRRGPVAAGVQGARLLPLSQRSQQSQQSGCTSVALPSLAAAGGTEAAGTETEAAGGTEGGAFALGHAAVTAGAGLAVSALPVAPGELGAAACGLESSSFKVCAFAAECSSCVLGI